MFCLSSCKVLRCLGTKEQKMDFNNFEAQARFLEYNHLEYAVECLNLHGHMPFFLATWCIGKMHHVGFSPVFIM